LPCLCCLRLSVAVVYIIVFYFFFFFSSRRRHTRFSRDWSSDVCSSDLEPERLLVNCVSDFSGRMGVSLSRRRVAGANPSCADPSVYDIPLAPIVNNATWLS